MRAGAEKPSTSPIASLTIVIVGIGRSSPGRLPGVLRTSDGSPAGSGPADKEIAIPLVDPGLCSQSKMSADEGLSPALQYQVNLGQAGIGQKGEGEQLRHGRLLQKVFSGGKGLSVPPHTDFADTVADGPK